MKVVLINGSAQAQGNTATALNIAAEVLEAQGLTVERIEIGKKGIRGCLGCGGCIKKQNQTCVQFTDEPVNEWIQAMVKADGLVIGSPVYYSGIAGNLKSFLDRAFYVSMVNGGLFRHKVGAAITAVRRAGSMPAFHQINNYFTITEMFIPSGNYWNGVFGTRPGEASQDTEGGQSVRVMAANMAWLLKLMEHGRGAVPPPALAQKEYMNFIR